MTFPAGEKDSKSDYHDNMDADIFMEWLEKRLLPAFQKLYPGFQMILILDNAPYHHGMMTSWKNPLLAKKDTNLATLRTLVEKKVELDREDGQDGIMAFRQEGPVFFPLPKAGEEFRRKPTGPSTEEVQRATYRIMRQKAPEMLETRAETFFREKGVGRLLHTPPYCPNAQPIELFWSHGKNDVASNFKGRRSLADVHQALRAAWYGGSDRVGAANCFKLVKHSFKYVQQLIEQDDVLTGEVILAKKLGDKTHVSLEKASIPTNYLVSKHGRLGRALEDAGVDIQAHDDAGPTPLFEITIDGPPDQGVGVEA
ncbi:unnamed protein product [Ectocarpus sp. 4 AP-2014]